MLRGRVGSDPATLPERRAPFHIAIPSVVAGYPASGGVGKVWRNSLHALRSLGVETSLVEPTAALARRPDVWLFDGHQGPLDVDEPTVALLQEAPWSDPELQAMLSPDWVKRYGPPSRNAARSATRVVTPSTSSAHQVAEDADISMDRIVTVPYGVDPRIFSARFRRRGTRLAARLGCRRPYVLAVSTVHPRKNLVSLVEAMASLATEGFPHGLLLIASAAPDGTVQPGLDPTGAPPGLKGRMTRTSGLSERDVAALMSGASAFCQPSLMEGFGLTVLEAMSAGAPTVVSDRGALPEVAGDAGLVVAPDPQSLAAGLRRVLTDVTFSRQLAAAGRARAAERPWSATASGWLRALAAAAGR